MAIIWTIASILCLIVAAIFLLLEKYDAAFVAAALGAVAWFLNYRARIRPIIPEDTETTLNEEEPSFEDDEEQ